MFAFALGVRRISEDLPGPVYALLTGLNASTVGIVALAAVQLAEKAIKDKLSRILVIAGACAGLCYNALWYFPVLLAIGGIVTVVWDGWLDQQIGKMRASWKRRRQSSAAPHSSSEVTDTIVLRDMGESSRDAQRRATAPRPSAKASLNAEILPQHSPEAGPALSTVPESVSTSHSIRPRTGLTITIAFFGTSTDSTSFSPADRPSLLRRSPRRPRQTQSTTSRAFPSREHVPRRHGDLRRRTRRDPSPAQLHR